MEESTDWDTLLEYPPYRARSSMAPKISGEMPKNCAFQNMSSPTGCGVSETGDSLRSQKITSHLCVQTGTPFPYTVLRPPSARLGMLWWPSWSLKVKENKHCWGLLGNVHPSLTCIFFWLFSVFQYIPNYLWQKDTKGRSTKLPIQGFPVVRKPLGCG